jgi:hypothetical protein
MQGLREFRVGLRLLVSASTCAAAVAVTTAASVAAEDCQNGSFTSTFELIQTAIFERNGCTNMLCHGGPQPGGGLDLRADVAWENLVDVPAQTPPVPGWRRVLAGQSSASLLWVNLAAKTFPDAWQAPLRPMPLDPLPPLTQNEVEALRLWIEKGAPRDGVIPGTAELLDACLPPPEPVEIKPLPPPAPGKGIQMKMPRWILPAHSEREICFATYYDITDQVPQQYQGPDGTFRYNFHQTRQDPLSHHMVPILYTGPTPPDSPLWGAFRCRGGIRDGESCDPLAIGICGEDSACASEPANSIGCIGYGPGDGGIGLTTAGISITQQTAEEFPYAPGVYAELPLKGVILWSSHAFNLTDKPGKLEAWLNFQFAEPQEQRSPVIPVFAADAVFKTNAPAFGTDEPCNVTVFPRHARVFELSSHMHQRGKRWRTFAGAFRCQGGPANGEACSPFGYDFASRDVCAGAPCVSLVRQHVGDCDANGEVTVDELTIAVNIALNLAPVSSCAEADTSYDDAVTVEEILTGVRAALEGVPPPVARDADASLLYVSLIYNDPVVLRLEQPLVLDSPFPEERAFTYCALYDNGFADPSTVKRRSTSPPAPISLPGVGGPCLTPTHCTQGLIGQPCSGRNERERNRSCDAGGEGGDGLCDACPLRGGVTTEDEMFILLGQYYIP